jgi:hypothetical protein
MNANSDSVAGEFTELDAARLYARLVNAFDAEPFIDRLASKLNYRSQWVMQELDTREAVADLLRGKILAMQESSPKNSARIGVATRIPHRGRPLVILSSLDQDKALGTVDFKVADGMITAISICVLPVHEPAFLTDPDNYVYAPQPEPAPDPLQVKPKRPPRPEPSADEIIATFADVPEALHAVVTDAAIAACPRSEWEPFVIVLVPPEHEALQDLGHPKLADVLAQAQRGELFLFAIFRAENLIGVSTLPRPTQPWAHLAYNEQRWHMRGGRPLWDFEISFDVSCELRLSSISGLLFSIAPLVARPRPVMPLVELRNRFDAILATASAPLSINSPDISTWPRFLDDGRHVAWHVAHNNVLASVSAEECDRRILELALEAWPQGNESNRI